MIEYHLAMNIALFMAGCAACAVNAYYLPTCLRISKGIALLRLFRVVGWLVMIARFGSVLLISDSIPTSFSAATGLFFLAAGEIVVLLNRGKVGLL